MIQLLVLVPFSDCSACEHLIFAKPLLEKFLHFFLCFLCTNFCVDSTYDNCVSSNESIDVLFLSIKLVLTHLCAKLEE